MKNTARAITLVTATFGALALAPLSAAHATPPTTCRGDAVTATAVTPTDGPDVITGTPGDDIINGGGGDDVIKGLGGDDIICGDVGNDTLKGGEGNDAFDGGTGADDVTGGAGLFDAIFYNTRVNAVRVTLDDAAGDGEPGINEGDNVHSDVEGVNGGAGNDLFIANPTIAARLAGELGNDTLIGGAGETLEGGDVLLGGEGDDTLKGGAGIDYLDGEQDDDTLKGGAGGDTLYGGTGDDSLKGGADSDLLRGGGDDDFLDGGSGGDDIKGELGFDTLSYASRTNPVTVTLNDSFSGANDGEAGEKDLAGADIEKVYGGSGADRLIGRDLFTDLLYGGPGGDKLKGLGAGDGLYGEAGADTIIGGDGTDLADGGNGINDHCDAETETNCEF